MFTLSELRFNGAALLRPEQPDVWIRHTGEGRKVGIEFEVQTCGKEGPSSLSVIVRGANNYRRNITSNFNVYRTAGKQTVPAEQRGTPLPAGLVKIDSHFRGEELFMTYDHSFG